MATSLGKMVIHLGLDSSGLQRGAQNAAKSVESLKNNVSGASGGMGGFSGQLGGAAMAMGAASAGATLLIEKLSEISTAVRTAITDFATWSLTLAAQSETATVSFEVLLGSLGQANTLIDQLRDVAAETPFNFAGLQDNAKMLLAFGMAGADIEPTLRMLGDVAMGDSEKLGRITLAFGQIQATGRLMGQDLLQLINAGFNPLQTISEQTGESMASLKKKMEDGQISFEMVRQAFVDVTSEGGRFYGMNEKASQTLTGRWDKLKESLQNIGREFGQKLAPAAGILLDAFMQLADELADFVIASGPAIEAFATAAAQALLDLVKILIDVGRYFIWVADNFSKGLRVLGVVGPEIEKATEPLAGAASNAAELGKQMEAAAAAAAAAEKATEKLMERGKQLTQSLRTPDEIFGDTLAELKTLQEAGAITWEFYVRGLKQAEDSLLKQFDTVKAIKEETQGVGAAERFTMGGFSAVQAAMRQSVDDKRAAEHAAKQRQQQIDLLAQANELAKNRKEFVVKQVSF